ncbi:MAG: XVIPCD domain-containing protein [Stenotrophomonas sp.]
MDARLGRVPDQNSTCMVASLSTLAASNRLDRVDHVLLSVQGNGTAPGHLVFVVQGDPGDPAHRRACMPTAQAIATPPEQSFQQLAALDRERSREPVQQMQREQAEPVRSVPAMHV